MARIRKSNGSGIVEGAVGICLVISALVIAAVFLANVGLVTFYKQKVGFCSSQLAATAAEEIASPFFKDEQAVEDDITTKMKALLAANGLGKGKLSDWKVTHDTTVLESPIAVSFKITVSGLKVISSPLPFGLKLAVPSSMSDTAAALIDPTRPRFCTEMVSECSQAGGGVGVAVWVPTYAGGTYENGQFSRQIGAYPKRRFTQVNFFGAADMYEGAPNGETWGALWNTNFPNGKPVNYPGVQTAFTKLFQIEGNN